MSRKTFLVVCMVLIISLLGCSGKKAVNKSDDSSASENMKISKTTSGDPMADLIEFNESIYEDVNERFTKAGLNLLSLKRDKKGDLVLAEISNTPHEIYAPKAVVLLHENFSSVEDIIIRCDNGKDYTIKEEFVAALFEKNTGSQLENAIWDELNKAIPSDDKTKPQAAGM